MVDLSFRQGILRRVGDNTVQTDPITPWPAAMPIFANATVSTSDTVSLISGLSIENPVAACVTVPPFVVHLSTYACVFNRIGILMHVVGM